MPATDTPRELPLQLLSLQTPKGTVRHLVSIEETDPVTLCGRGTGVNPRHVFVGTWVENIQSADNATCKKCRTVAATMED
jgi:hypothetical protein